MAADALSREELDARLLRLQQRAQGDAHLTAQLRRAGIPSTSAPASSTPPVLPPLAAGERTSALPHPHMAMPPWLAAPPYVACPPSHPGQGIPQRTAAPGRPGWHATHTTDRAPELLPPLERGWFLEADVLVTVAAGLCILVLGLVALALV